MKNAMKPIQTTSLTEVRRMANRASLDKAALYDFIDHTLLCFVGFTYEDQVRVIPTCQWRDGDYIYWHGHAKAGNIINTQQPKKICMTIGEIDSLVMARSAFHHSINYHSAMIFGIPELVTDPAEKKKQFEIFVNKISTDRWHQLRPITDTEIKATGMMKVKLDEVSFKLRDGDVNDDEADMDWPVWAGIIPKTKSWEPPVQDAKQHDPMALPHRPDFF